MLICITKERRIDQIPSITVGTTLVAVDVLSSVYMKQFFEASTHVWAQHSNLDLDWYKNIKQNWGM